MTEVTGQSFTCQSFMCLLCSLGSCSFLSLFFVPHPCMLPYGLPENGETLLGDQACFEASKAREARIKPPAAESSIPGKWVC